MWILRDNKPERIEIQIGARDSDKSEIISDKIQENDKVIIKKKSDSKNGNKASRPPMRMF